MSYLQIHNFQYDHKLYRIQFYRGISSFIKKNSIMKCIIIYCNEFNYNILNLKGYDMNMNNLEVMLVRKETSSITSRTLSKHLISCRDISCRNDDDNNNDL